MGDGGTNVSGLGARLELTYPDRTEHHVVGSGWGAGNDTQGVLILGLGNRKALTTATVYWPDGTHQDFEPVVGEVLTVQDTIEPEYVSESLDVSYVGLPDAELDLVCTWETTNAVDPARTRVLVTNPSSPGCDVFPDVLKPKDLEATYIVSRRSDGVYEHSFTWHGDCIPLCRFEVQVHCETNSGDFYTETRLLRVRTCLNGFPFGG